MNQPDPHELHQAQAQLAETEHLVERLHKLCCEPDRSPRMQSILRDIAGVREHLTEFEGEQAAPEVIAALEEIGAQVGRLQVACCTEARMPLYAETLNNLAATQVHVSRSIGRGH